MAPKSTATGSYGASHGASAATSSMSTTMPAPMAPRGRRRQNARRTDIHFERASAVGASAATSIAGVIAIGLPVPDPRVEPGVHQVHQEVDDDEDGRHLEHQGLGERVVSVGHRLDEEEAEAHVYLAETKRILDWDLDGAEAEFNRAVEIDPNSTPSNYFSAALYAARGDRDKALAYLQRTSKIDPASLWVSNYACELYRYFGLYDEAIVAGERALQLDPTFAHYGEPALAALYREMGRFDDAIALYQKAREFTGRPGFGLAITYARMKQREKALDALEGAVAGWGYRPGDAIAHVHVTLGAHDDAIRELEHACEQRSSSLHGVGIAPEFVPLRSDKRFRSILQRIGLEPEKIFAATAV